MTNQEIFNKVRDHLLKQNAQALVPGTTTCRYRDMRGNKCAVGCLISDEMYRLDMEGLRVSDALLTDDDYSQWGRAKKIMVPALAQAIGELNTSNLNLLAGLQNIHDNFLPPSWEKKLGQLAVDFELVP